jgi:hypothetical protein
MSRPLYPFGGRASDFHGMGGWMGAGTGLYIVERRKISLLCLESNFLLVEPEVNSVIRVKSIRYGLQILCS